MCSINSGQLIGWPLWRRTSAAASSALSLDGAFAVPAAGAAWGSGVFGVGGLADFFLLPVGAGSDEGRFFLAVMGALRGRPLARGGAPVAPPSQGRRTTATVPAVPGNSRWNSADSRHGTCAIGLRRGRTTLLGRTLELAPAPALLVPVQRRRHGQHLTQHRCR